MKKRILTRIIGLLWITHLFFACSSDEMNNNPGNPKPPPDPPQTYLALGDSYTIGQSVAEEDRFPVILSNLLNERGILFELPQIVARTGWTTDELAAGIIGENIQGSFDFVSLLIGVNNQYRGRSAMEYKTEFAGLLNTAIGFAENDLNKVVVLSIPDWGRTPFGNNQDTLKISEEIDLFNQNALEVCQQRGVRFINITEMTRSLVSDETYLASDGLHYSGKMHRKWAEEIINIQFQ
jgi:lysophospholipase L1-like esterase